MRQRGFTLVEVLVAMGVILLATLGGMQLLTMAIGMMSEARTHALATRLASSRMEQLRALRFEFDASGQPVTDTTADLAADPPGPGGSGLTPSGPSALADSTPGYVDYLDAQGRWVGSGASPPGGASLVRRWSVEPADAGGHLLVLQVLVRRVDVDASGAVGRVAGEVRLTTQRARTRR